MGAGILDVNIIEITEEGEIGNPYRMTIKTMAMVHNVPTYGYRFETTEGVVVVSGDTAPHIGIIELSRNADLLVIDAALIKGRESTALDRIWVQLQKEHCTPK